MAHTRPTQIENPRTGFLSNRQIPPTMDKAGEKPLSSPQKRSRPIKLAIGALLALTTGCEYLQQNSYITEIPWALTGEWVTADLHTHTRFSDGSYPLAALVDKAAQGGCDVLAITDHSDLSERAASPQYFQAIAQARQIHPELILFGGLEWNIPSYQGREHITMLLEPSLEQPLLGEFKQRFEPSSASDEEALSWLASQLPSEDDAVLFYNHPSRKDADVRENLSDYIHWSTGNTLFAGFEGAPGHQKTKPVGAYHQALKTVDRWDPVAGMIGGVWDTLLDRGANIWAAIASSDFHNDSLDYPPCQFARIHIQVPERSHRGVLQALRAGSFWAGHGKVIDSLTVLLAAEGIELPLSPGEAARIENGEAIQLAVTISRNPENEPTPLIVEVIGNGRNGMPQLLESATLPPQQQTVRWSFSALQPGGDGESVYFRVRVRKPVQDGPDLLSYSNPIRLYLD